MSYEENPFLQIDQMTDFDSERFMIQVRLLAALRNLVNDNGVAKCDV